MENQLRAKFRLNWSKMKEELSVRWAMILDLSLEKGIVGFDDMEGIRALPIDSDKIQTILLKVVKLRQCELFINLLEDKGFSTLCKYIKETVISFEDADRGIASPDESPKSPNTFEKVLNQAVEDLKQDLYERDEMLNEQLKKRDTSLNNELKERDELLHEEFRQYIDEKLNVVAIENKKAVDLYEKCLDWEEKYIQLQSSHQSARDRINDLTILAQEKTLENSKLREQVQRLKEAIEELEMVRSVQEESDVDHEALENQKELLSQLEAAYNEKVEEIERLNKITEEQTSLITTKEKELHEAKGNFELLRIEKENLQKQQDHEVADRASVIMNRLEKLIQEHDVASGVTGKAYIMPFKPRGTLFSRRS